MEGRYICRSGDLVQKGIYRYSMTKEGSGSGVQSLLGFFPGPERVQSQDLGSWAFFLESEESSDERSNDFLSDDVVNFIFILLKRPFTCVVPNDTNSVSSLFLISKS